VLLVVVQFALLGYAPGEYVPTSEDRRQAATAEAAIESIDAPAFSPIYPYVSLRAGHEPVAHKMAIVDVLRASPHDARASLREDIGRSMRGHRYRALLLHNERHPLAPFTDGYRLAHRLSGAERPPVPITGIEISPRYVFLPTNRSEGRTA
jgi:hypothetical protein